MARYAPCGNFGVVLAALVVFGVTLGSAWTPQQTCVADSAPATTRAVVAAKEPPSLALLDVLTGVKWFTKPRKEWTTRVIAHMEDLSARQKTLVKFNLAERDNLLAKLASTLAKLDPHSKAKCLILEHIAESGGTWPRYERLIVLAPDGIERQTLDELRQHNAIELKEDGWVIMDGWINTSVKGGGSDHGIGRVMDGGDTTVISYYDGSHWQVAVLMWFEIYLFQLHNPPGKPPVKDAVPSADVVAYGNLLNFLDTFPEVREHFAPERYNYLKEYTGYLSQDQGEKKDQKTGQGSIPR